MSRHVTILGAGLVGSLLAIILRRKGHAVTIYERRPDMRAAKVEAGRSINLAMSTRGWHALELAGLKEEMETLAIPMNGRFLHQPDGDTAFQPYGANNEAIFSISRGELNKRLMTLAEQQGADIQFGKRCQKVDLISNTVYLQDIATGSDQNIEADMLFGADGAHSALRHSYMYADRVNATQHYIEYGYKELAIPAGPNGTWLMEKHALHIWPRGKFMLIALPNIDGSFTCTMFMPFEGPDSYEQLEDEESVVPFFEKHFADVLPLMPDYKEQFSRNPTASLITTRIFPWHVGDRSALIGDAAHAIVPFYGQGMNAGFEDCSVLAGLIDAHGNDWETILDEYEAARKPNGDAVAELALLNFTEMRDKVADPKFLERKKIEKELAKRYPQQFTSVYEMVSFTHTPYAGALEAIQAQDALLHRIMSHGDFTANSNDTNFTNQLDEWMSDYARTVQQAPQHPHGQPQ